MREIVALHDAGRAHHGDDLVAVDNFSYYPDNDLPTIDSFTPNVEAIAEMLASGGMRNVAVPSVYI